MPPEGTEMIYYKGGEYTIDTHALSKIRQLHFKCDKVWINVMWFMFSEVCLLLFDMSLSTGWTCVWFQQERLPVQSMNKLWMHCTALNFKWSTLFLLFFFNVYVQCAVFAVIQFGKAS